MSAAFIGGEAGSADACAGLIGSNGAVNLGRTTTLAAYENGVEHYVTAFQFQGGGGEFGTLIPLPGVPTNVERGGAWTLQRLQLETQPPFAGFSRLAEADEAFAGAQVLQEVRIDALDITVLKGGGPDVAAWATEHGFRLSPDAPEVLDFYASRSPIFLAAVFDGAAAAERGQVLGDGTPVSITIPTDNPWVPLRILALGKQAEDRVEADVFLLTSGEPALLPSPASGLFLAHSQPATDLLLDDLRSDDGMGWIPDSGWLTKLQIDTTAADLGFDLAVDTSGNDNPSRVAAGLDLPDFRLDPGILGVTTGDESGGGSVLWPLAAVFGLLVTMVVIGRRAAGARQ
jgi:hypothetical protein